MIMMTAVLLCIVIALAIQGRDVTPLGTAIIGFLGGFYFAAERGH